jgi:hypothetical protein
MTTSMRERDREGDIQPLAHLTDPCHNRFAGLGSSPFEPGEPGPRHSPGAGLFYSVNP